MKQSQLAFYKGIDAVSDDVKSLINLNKKEKKEGLALIKKKLAQTVKPLPFGSAIKASTIEDVTAQASSFIELITIGQNASLPQPTDIEIDYHYALNDLLISTNKEQEDLARDKMARCLKNGLRPLSFYKSRVTDGFLILQDDKKRLFVFVNLWSAKDKRANKINVKATNTRTNELITFTSGNGLLLPLECSQWHIDALKKGQSKAAKLSYRDHSFYLSVSVEYETTKRKPNLIMGVDRGIEEIATYVIRRQNGEVVKSGTLSGVALRNHQRRLEKKQKEDQRAGKRFISGWSNYSNNLMHHVANEIVAIADKYNAQVVIEDLSTIKNGAHHKRMFATRKGGFRRMLSRQQYGKLEFMLTYKLNYAGLPKPFLVNAAYTSLTCPQCGHADKANRPERAVFFCKECAYSNHADVIGALNIAGKKLWFDAVRKHMIKNKPLKHELQFKIWQSANLSL